MLKTRKKGFTIVELVIVIAVVAVLAAVLIPTFASLVKKANVSNDTMLIKNLNTALTLDAATENDNVTMGDAMADIAGQGFDLTKLTPRSSGEILWDSVNNVFALVEGGELVYGMDVTKDVLKNSKYKMWKIAKTIDELKDEYSHYLDPSFAPAALTVSTGLDVGKVSDIPSINFTTSEARDVVIRTNGTSTKLTINAENSNVKHCGDAGEIHIAAVKDASYHEQGGVYGLLSISKGRLVIEDAANVKNSVIVKNTTGPVQIVTNQTLFVAVEESAAAHAVKIESEKPMYIDDKTNGGTVTKPANVIEPTEINKQSIANYKADSDAGYANFSAENPYVLEIKTGTTYYKLTEDISVDDMIVVKAGITAVLDLNGHAIESTFSGFCIGNWGNLTILDSTGTDAGRIYNIDKDLPYLPGGGYGYGHDAIRNFGKLTINGGTFGDANNDQTDANDTTYGAAVRNQADATCVINGGKFTCVDNYGCWSNLDESVYSYAIRSYGELIINNATVYGKMNGGIAANDGHITINGGDFNLAGTNTYYVLCTSSGSITVNAGRFTRTDLNKLLGGFDGMPSWDATQDLQRNKFTINGGIFTVDGETVDLTK